MGGDGVLVAYHRDLQSDQLKRVESTGFRGFSVLIQLAFEKSVHFRLRVNFVVAATIHVHSADSLETRFLVVRFLRILKLRSHFKHTGG